MARAIEKRITIEIEYTDTQALKDVFDKINSDLLTGKTFDRMAFGSSMYQYRKTLSVLPTYREEKINGVWCMVYQSKINKK